MKKIDKNIFSTTAFLSIISALIWEIGEEVLENLIAQTLANFLVMFITKLLSVLTVIILTKSVKKVLSKTLMPLIKNLTYKEGLDKMQTLKKFFNKLGKAIVGGVKFVCVSNPKTSLATLLGVSLSYGLGVVMDTQNILELIHLPEITIFGIEIVPYILAVLNFIILYFFGIKFGVETNAEADERKTIEKAEKEKEKAEKERLLQEEKKKKEQEEREAQAKAEQEAFEQEAQRLAEEIIRKAEEERVAKEREEQEAKAKAEQEARELEKQEKLRKRAEEILNARKKLEEENKSSETDINIIL